VGNGEVLGKPGTRENAVRQLRTLSGSRRVLHGSVRAQHLVGTSRTRVSPAASLPQLDDGTIDRYLPGATYDCAGSAKAEGLESR